MKHISTLYLWYNILTTPQSINVQIMDVDSSSVCEYCSLQQAAVCPMQSSNKSITGPCVRPDWVSDNQVKHSNLLWPQKSPMSADFGNSIGPRKYQEYASIRVGHALLPHFIPCLAKWPCISLVIILFIVRLYWEMTNWNIENPNPHNNHVCSSFVELRAIRECNAPCYYVVDAQSRLVTHGAPLLNLDTDY